MRDGQIARRFGIFRQIFLWIDAVRNEEDAPGRPADPRLVLIMLGDADKPQRIDKISQPDGWKRSLAARHFFPTLQRGARTI